MGNKAGKQKLPKKIKLTSKDIKFLSKQTGRSKDEIKEVIKILSYLFDLTK
jgi:5-bromo-4-chloroindolyl phosphate hydrolysis protein